MQRLWVCLAFVVWSTFLWGGIHTLPSIVVASDLKFLPSIPIDKIRVFSNFGNGQPEAIPFQIDEKDPYGDFILDQGKNPNIVFSNKAFDGIDELSVMGDDVGVAVPPKWPVTSRPQAVYEIRFQNKVDSGAIYLAVFEVPPPQVAQKRYVGFDYNNERVETSRYTYEFNKKNYLVVRGVSLQQKEAPKKLLIGASTVFLKLDLKYFFTVSIGDADITSELDAIKIGPVRTIARVNFSYKVMKLKFDIGMYTEVSFFSNAVILPAVIDNPLDGKKILNKGSYFYYGLSLVDSPGDLALQTNMPFYKDKSGFLAWISDKSKWKDPFWATATNPSYMMYLEFTPSTQMRNDKNIPYLFTENVPASKIKDRNASKPKGLGESPANLAIAFDFDQLAKGIHDIRFRLFIENSYDAKRLQEYSQIDQWVPSWARLASF